MAEQISGLTVGRCLSPKAAALCYPAQEFCHIDGDHIGDHDLNQLLELWELAPPNLILEIRGANRPHPRMMVDKRDSAIKELEVFVTEARETLGKLKRVDSSSVTDGDLKLLLGERLYDKIVNTVITMLRACEETNSWITFVGGPTLAIPLVEAALSRCEARPVIFACESPKDYGCEATFGERLMQSKQPITDSDGDLRSLPSTVMPDDSWSHEFHLDIHKMPNAPGGKFPCSYATHFISCYGLARRKHFTFRATAQKEWQLESQRMSRASS